MLGKAATPISVSAFLAEREEQLVRFLLINDAGPSRTVFQDWGLLATPNAGYIAVDLPALEAVKFALILVNNGHRVVIDPYPPVGGSSVWVWHPMRRGGPWYVPALPTLTIAA